jgi:capsular polysaccharide biosynthesis protein
LLEDYLSSIGFDILYLEDLSIQDQITRFSAAKVVVAPHGAGLSNIVFLDEGARVLEYSAGEWWWPCFRRIAFGLGLDYEFLLLPAYPSAPNGRAEDAISLVRQALDKNRID